MGNCIARPKRKFDKENLSQPKTSKTKSRSSSKEHGKELRNKNGRSKKSTSSESQLNEDVSIEDMIKIYPGNMGNELNKKIQKEQPQQVVSKVYQTAKPVAVTSVLKTLPSTSSQNMSGNTEPYIYLPSNTSLRKSESPIKNNNFNGSNTQTTLSSGLKATLLTTKSHSIHDANKNVRPCFNMYENSDIPASKLLEVKIIDNPNEQVTPRQCVVSVDNLPQISYPLIYSASDVHHDSFSIIQEKGTRPQPLLEIAKSFSDKTILNPTEAPKKPQRNVEKIEPTARDMSGLSERFQITSLAHSTTLSEPRHFCEPIQSSSKIQEFKSPENDNQNVPNVAHSTSISISPNICEAVESSEGFIKEPFDAIGNQKKDTAKSCLSNKKAIELPANSITPAAAQDSITEILRRNQDSTKRLKIYEEKPQQQNLGVPNQTQGHSAYSLPYPYTNDVKSLKDTAEYSRISPVTKMKENEKEVPSELTISETKQEENPHEQTSIDTEANSRKNQRNVEKIEPTAIDTSGLSEIEICQKTYFAHSTTLSEPRFFCEPVQSPSKIQEFKLPENDNQNVQNVAYSTSVSISPNICEAVESSEGFIKEPFNAIGNQKKDAAKSCLSNKKAIELPSNSIMPAAAQLSITEILRINQDSTKRSKIYEGKHQEQNLGVPNQTQAHSAYSLQCPYTNDVKPLRDTAEDSRISAVNKIEEYVPKKEVLIKVNISKTKQKEKPYEQTITDTNIKSLSGYETPSYHKEDQNLEKIEPTARDISGLSEIERDQMTYLPQGKPQQQNLDVLNQTQTHSAYSLPYPYTNDVKPLRTAKDLRISPVSKMEESVPKKEVLIKINISKTKQLYEQPITDIEAKSLSGYEAPRYHKEDPNYFYEKEEIPFEITDTITDTDTIPNQSQTYSEYSLSYPYTNDVKPLRDTAEDSRISPVIKLKESEKEVPIQLTISETKQEEKPHEQTSIDTEANSLSGYETESYHKENTNLQSIQDDDILEFNPIESVSSKAMLNKTREENSHEYPQQPMSARSLYSNENNEKYLTEVQNTPNNEYSSTYSHELSFSGPIIKSSQEEDTNKPNSKQTYQEESFEIRTKQHDENHNGISASSRDSGKKFQEFVSGMFNESGYDYYNNSDIAYEEQNWQQNHDNSDESNATETRIEDYQIPEMQVPDAKFDNKEIHRVKSGDDNDSDLLPFSENEQPIQDNTSTKEDITLSSTRLLEGLCVLDKKAVEIQQDDRMGSERKDEINFQITQDRVIGEPQTVDELPAPTTEENNNMLPEIAPPDEPEPHQPTEENERHLRLLLDAGTGNQISQQLYNSVICSLDEIKRQAEPFEEEIRNFTELEGSDKHYYIEESLRRLIDKLDDMFDDIGNVELLREERKRVYGFIFPMFERLDEKVIENRERQEWERGGWLVD